MDFRDELLEAVYDCLYELEIHSDDPDPTRPGKFYPERQDPTNPIKVRQPNIIPGTKEDRYLTQTWQTQLRPIRPDDIGDNHLIPTVFLRAAGGRRSAKGENLQDSPRRTAIGNISEDFQIDIQGVFRDSYGAPDEHGNALPLSKQINNFICDLDKLLNANTLSASMSTDINIPDAYIVGWESEQALKGTADEIVVAALIIQIEYRREGF